MNIRGFKIINVYKPHPGWCYPLSSRVRGIGAWCTALQNSSNMSEKQGRTVATSTSFYLGNVFTIFHPCKNKFMILKQHKTTKQEKITLNGHSITAQAVTIDEFPSLASNYSLGRRFHYSVPVKHCGAPIFASGTHVDVRTDILPSCVYVSKQRLQLPVHE